jgi:hypothetical protein
VNQSLQPVTFIKPPPQSVCHLFRPLPSDATDPIAGHMSMFDREMNAGSYWTTVDETASVLAGVVVRWMRFKPVQK